MIPSRAQGGRRCKWSGGAWYCQAQNGNTVMSWREGDEGSRIQFKKRKKVSEYPRPSKRKRMRPRPSCMIMKMASHASLINRLLRAPCVCKFVSSLSNGESTILSCQGVAVRRRPVLMIPAEAPPPPPPPMSSSSSRRRQPIRPPRRAILPASARNVCGRNSIRSMRRWSWWGTGRTSAGRTGASCPGSSRWCGRRSARCWTGGTGRSGPSRPTSSGPRG